MRRLHGLRALFLAGVAGCGGGDGTQRSPAPASLGATVTVQETTITATFDAAGVAAAVERATLSTRLMGSVTAVLVQEGDRVRRGQVLARVDARDVDAKRAQVEAGIAASEAMYSDAVTQAARFRALYADSAATRYQLDQVETGLARAEAGLRAARAARGELDAVGAYAGIEAPFSGVVTARFVDPGAFVAPGAPVVEVQDASRLRISVSVPPRLAATLRPGTRLAAMVETTEASATVEGVVPAPAGAVYTVNAVVDNRERRLLPGSAATLRLPEGERQAILVPARLLVREGDLVGVRVAGTAGGELRWLRVQPVPEAGAEPMVEVLSGLRAGDRLAAGSR